MKKNILFIAALFSTFCLFQLSAQEDKDSNVANEDEVSMSTQEVQPAPQIDEQTTPSLPTDEDSACNMKSKIKKGTPLSANWDDEDDDEEDDNDEDFTVNSDLSGNSLAKWDWDDDSDDDDDEDDQQDDGEDFLMS